RAAGGRRSDRPHRARALRGAASPWSGGGASRGVSGRHPRRLCTRSCAYPELLMSETPTREIPYAVRRSTRARRVRVNVHVHTGVEVVLPPRAPERAVAAAVSELRP